MISDTFGMESVVITDTTGGRVCLECSFSSFSTDTGCTVELVSSGSVNYRETFTRRGNTVLLKDECLEYLQESMLSEYMIRVAHSWFMRLIMSQCQYRCHLYTTNIMPCFFC